MARQCATEKGKKESLGEVFSLDLNTVTESLLTTVFTAQCYACAVLAMGLCPSVSVCLCLSQVGVLLKRLNVGSHKQHQDSTGNLVF